MHFWLEEAKDRDNESCIMPSVQLCTWPSFLRLSAILVIWRIECNAPTQYIHDLRLPRSLLCNFWTICLVSLICVCGGRRGGAPVHIKAGFSFEIRRWWPDSDSWYKCPVLQTGSVYSKSSLTFVTSRSRAETDLTQVYLENGHETGDC